jgi:hypothetical protein
VTTTDATQKSHRQHPPFSVAVDQRALTLDVRRQDRSLKIHASNSLYLAQGNRKLPNPTSPICIIAEDCAAVCDLNHTGSTSLAEIICIVCLSSRLRGTTQIIQRSAAIRDLPMSVGTPIASRAIGAGLCAAGAETFSTCKGGGLLVIRRRHGWRVHPRCAFLPGTDEKPHISLFATPLGTVCAFWPKTRPRRQRRKPNQMFARGSGECCRQLPGKLNTIDCYDSK